MTNSRHTSLNNSTSKQFYSFSKTQRFPEKKSLNQNVSYNHKSEFNVPKAGGLGFNGTQRRFDYYGSAEKQKKKPSPSPL